MTSPVPKSTVALSAFCDALLPLDESEWGARVPPSVAARIATLPGTQRERLERWLRLFDSPLGSGIFGASLTPLSRMPRERRSAFLRGLRDSRNPAVRAGFEALKRLAATAYYAECDETGRNPVWDRMGYPGPVATGMAAPRSLQPLRIDGQAKLSCDVAVVGSGAGGGVVAAELAESGLDVVVVEQGGHFDDESFDQREASALERMYLQGAACASRDGGILILAGSCLGGGTVVNYTTSFRTPDAIRAEWARQSGLSLFVEDDFTRALDAVCEGFRVSTDQSQPSARDAIMERGLKHLGWHHARIPRNVAGCPQDDRCGYCGFGCVTGAKQSTLKTYLRRAVDRGAQIVVECTVERVLVEGGRAVGVLCRSRGGHRVEVVSKLVVVAAGAIGTPALLLRSGLRGQVGQNLRLHPATAVWAYVDEEVRPWTGTLQAVYSDELANLDDGYGVKFETAPLHPAFSALGVAWDSAEQLDLHMRNLPHATFVAFLSRDRYGGTVHVDREGEPVVTYRVSKYDQHHVRRGVEAAARILAAAGARRVFSAQIRPIGFDPGSESLDDWMTRVDRVGYGPQQTYYFSFHQMGTCRMGVDPRSSAVNGDGESHEVRDLYVADSSLFPTALGTNPMITVGALGFHVAQRVKERLGYSTGRASRGVA